MSPVPRHFRRDTLDCGARGSGVTDDGASVPRSTWEVNSNFHLLTSKLFQPSQTSEKQNKPCSYCTATKLLVVLIFSFKSVFFHHSISPYPPRSSPPSSPRNSHL